MNSPNDSVTGMDFLQQDPAPAARALVHPREGQRTISDVYVLREVSDRTSVSILIGVHNYEFTAQAWGTALFSECHFDQDATYLEAHDRASALLKHLRSPHRRTAARVLKRSWASFTTVSPAAEFSRGPSMMNPTINRPIVPRGYMETATPSVGKCGLAGRRAFGGAGDVDVNVNCSVSGMLQLGNSLEPQPMAKIEIENTAKSTTTPPDSPPEISLASPHSDPWHKPHFRRLQSLHSRRTQSMCNLRALISQLSA